MVVVSVGCGLDVDDCVDDGSGEGDDCSCV